MAGSVKRVALVSMHTSPVEQAGTGDSGGLNISLMSTATELAARGVEVDLLTRATSVPRTTQLSDGVVLRELAAGPAAPLGKAELASVADEFGEAVASVAGRPGSRYDLIHAHYWLSGLATLPVAIELGIPLVQSFHTLGAMKNSHLAPGQDAEPAGRLLAERYLANQANAMVASSTSEVTSLIDQVGAPAGRIWVIPPGVDVDLFRPDRGGAAERVREQFGIEPGRPIVAVVGRVQPLKDQELGVRALGALNALRGWAPVLVIAGESTPGDEAYLASLHHLAAQLGVGDEVRFAGALGRDDLADLLAVASITLVPSHSETFGLVALESAASGTAVIGYRGTGMLESIAEGRSGVLVDSREPDAWARAMVALLDDPSARSRMAETAREHALGYTWAATATALLGVYTSLLA
ncbi:MAG TPA: glycosyltransferase [Homoserinimonas sp.]|nr:glycosyltransferase [Homoserinimonas sp.]